MRNRSIKLALLFFANASSFIIRGYRIRSVDTTKRRGIVSLRPGGGQVHARPISLPLIRAHSSRDGRISLKSSAEECGSDERSRVLARLDKVEKFVENNFFLVGMFVAVALARAFPALGRTGGVLRPELFIGKYGVALIFLLSGLSLELAQLTKAFSNVKLNAMVQLSIFAAYPFLVGTSLKATLGTVLPSVFPPALVDGLLILTCLPTTVNMNVILTSASGGNVAAALCNAVGSNLVGIFATPALIFRFFGSQMKLPFLAMVLKLSKQVLLPVAIGQSLRRTKVKDFYASHSKTFKRIQEVILLSILWNAFCTAFSQSIGLDFRSSLGLLILLPIVHLIALGSLFALFSIPNLGFDRGEVVAAMFCASQKTLAFGLPLINTIFEGHSNLATYCAPLMFIHPLQLIIGSMLVPRLQKYTEKSTQS